MSPLQFSTNVLAKAHRLLAVVEDGGSKVRPDPEHSNIWWIESSEGVQRYRVQTDYRPETRSMTWLTCTCKHGLNVGGGSARCWHAAAVLILLKEGEVATDHRSLGTIGGIERCSCGWPTVEDRRMHTPRWRADFSEHLLERRRTI